ncbi:MAG: Rieske (2Fe-2S) protein [Pseudanabaenaceae cyanobacterium bins.39]|nr:Rieske (2Fe-2S) protein [Pseudanabaenaceae cyanobacterium bins.39]
MSWNRRKLLSWFGLGWVASLLPSSLVGCAEANTPEAAKTTAATAAAPVDKVASAPKGEFKSVGKVSQLDKDGQIVSGKIAVVRDPQNASKLLAVDITCTHKGCDVQWKKDKKQFVCPCHDAEFAPNGTVKEGPADKPLKSFVAKIEKDEVLVAV